MLPFGVQMGHDWGIGTLAYFHASGKLLKAFSTTVTKLNAARSFFTENGAYAFLPIGRTSSSAHNNLIK